MPVSVEQWWARRQWVTGRDVPHPIGEFRDAWAAFPRLVEQFHPDRNHELVLSQIPPAADVWLLWVCGIGHDFVATPAEQRARPARSRSRRSWCPVCATPSALPPAPKWPRGIPRPAPSSGSPHPADPAAAPESGLHNSGVGESVGSGSPASVQGSRPSRRRVAHVPAARTPEVWRSAGEVAPGAAFVSGAASRASSAAQERLRMLVAERLDVDLSPNAVRVRTPFFGRLEVWPDLVLPELAIAVELDTIGRAGDEHVGERERVDRRKDKVLADVGWIVIRMRCRPLRALGAHDLVVPGVSARAVDALVDRMAAVRGELMVAAYRSPRAG
ncbi:MAG: endonuclease domain-containing protein [Actinobacteria bacterium]|nr:endonuclease domain-containing protein [Actinomycetota bacterium]MBU1609809.1 endonuclease domain-containing protein [Actinomycetota bacterium]MBU2316314.1 endonuclease domain-containing protein [Actinomycetota bacterium]MBU2385790.1 endonuclease domain-containing protein [Actinomycetota bacterium]